MSPTLRLSSCQSKTRVLRGLARLLRWAIGGLLPCLMASCASMAGTGDPAMQDLTDARLVREEHVFFSPGGTTRIERWRYPEEALAQVVRAHRYTSGLLLTGDIRLIHPSHGGQWQLSLGGVLQPLSSFGHEGPDYPQPLVTPEAVQWQGSFVHGGVSWRLVVFRFVVPEPLPGIASEVPHALDLLLWQTRAGPVVGSAAFVTAQPPGRPAVPGRDPGRFLSHDGR